MKELKIGSLLIGKKAYLGVILGFFLQEWYGVPSFLIKIMI